MTLIFRNLTLHLKLSTIHVRRKFICLIMLLICFPMLGPSNSTSRIGALAAARTFNDLEAFESYINRDGSPYVQTISKGGIKVSLRYVPTEAMMIDAYRDYLEAQDTLNDSLSNDEQRFSRLDETKNELLEWERTYDQSLYFHLTIGYEDESKDIIYEKMREGYGPYSQWLQKLMFGLQESIYLQSPTNDEVPLDMYHMERTFGLQKSQTFLLLFPAQFNGRRVLDARNEWLKLRIKEFGLGIGPLTFTFDLPFEEIRYQAKLLE